MVADMCLATHNGPAPVAASRQEAHADLRRVFGCFVTGVTVVTTWHDGRAHGMTANAFTSVSLDPPLVLVSIAKTAATCGRIAASQAFAVNILADGQEDLARRFAGRHRHMTDPFADLPYTSGASGSPLMRDVVAWIDCVLHGAYDGGDHRLFLGQIVNNSLDASKTPLLFYAGAFTGLRRSEGERSCRSA